MSQYVNFYLRVNNNFAPIGDYCRSSLIYKTFCDKLPYEKIIRLTPLTLENLSYRLEAEQRDIVKRIQILEQEIKDIWAANNSLEEKCELVAETRDLIEEMQEIIKEYDSAVSLIYTFIGMINTYRYSDVHFENDCEHYIYAGIESYGDIDSIEEDTE